jgi:DNA-binding response OmpR family regulator
LSFEKGRNEMKNVTILVVDDEARMRKLIKDFLVKSDFKVLEAENGEVALEQFEKHKNEIKVILLDVMMPKMDGWHVLQNIRKTSNTPVIMLTAKGEEQDELFGFELGADEYISKPFSPKILVARVEAILNRIKKEPITKKAMGGIEINNDGRSVLVDGKEVDLSLREYDLLKFLIDNYGVVLTREKILSKVWDFDYYGDSRTIDSHVKRLRHKLGRKGKYIDTVRGVGYKFEVK